MANELYLYEVFKSVLSASTVIEGRFIVAEGYGNDLNTNNFDDIVKDALSSVAPLGRKYPIAILLPPIETIEKYNQGWSTFSLEMYFLCKSFQTGTNDIMNLNSFNNTSDHPIKWDWKDMAECARDFRVVLNNTVKNLSLMGYIRENRREPDFIKRVSNMGNDKLSGVYIQFKYDVFVGCEINDYTDQSIASITAPQMNTLHQTHKH